MPEVNPERAAFLDRVRHYVTEGECEDLLVLVATLDDALQPRLGVQDFKALAHAALTGLAYAIERAHGAPMHARRYDGPAHERITRAREVANPESGGT